MGSLGKLMKVEEMVDPNSLSIMSRASVVEKGGT